MPDVTELVFRIVGENIEVLDQTGNKLGEVVTKAQDAGGATAELGRGGAAALAQLQAAATEAAKAVQALGGIATQAHVNVGGLADAATKAQTEAKGLGHALGVSAQSATTLAGAADQASMKLGGIREQASGAVAGLRAYAAEMEIATAAGIGLAAAAAGVAYVIGKSGQENVRRVDELNALALASGLTARELSQLEYVARAHQVTLGALGGGYVALNRSVAEAANGAGRDARVFKALDVDVRNSNGTLRDNTAILRDLADRFDQLPSGVEKSAAAAALFAGNADVMLKVMRGGSAEFDRLIGRADALGFTLDDKTASSATRITDALARTSAAAYGVGISLGQPVLGPVANFAEGLASVAEHANEAARSGAGAGAIFTFIGQAALANFPALRAFVDLYKLLPSAPDPRLAADYVPTQDATDITGAVGQVGRGIALRKALADALGRPERSRQGGGGGGRDNGDAALRKAEREHELEVARSLQEREQVRVALAERDVVLRGEAVKRAEEVLNLARQYGESESTQLALAKELDDLERQRLLAVRRRVETEFEGLTRYGPVLDDQYVKLGTQLDVIDEQLTKAPDHVARLTAEFEKTHSVVGKIGDVLSNSLNRAVDGLLAQDGKNFDIGAVLTGTGRAATSEFAGNFIKGINFKGLAGNVGSLFTGTGGGNQVLSGDALGNLGAAAASFGVTVALDLAFNAQRRTQELYQNTNTLRTTLNRGDIIYAAGGGGLVGSLGKLSAKDPLTNYFLNAFGLMQAPTGGTQRAMALEQLFKRNGLPQQSTFELGGHGGLRAQFLTVAPNQAIEDAFAAVGYGRDVPGLRQPTLETLGTTFDAGGGNIGAYSKHPLKVRELRGDLEAAIAANPELAQFYTGEALAFGQVATAGPRRARTTATLLTSNFLLEGVSVGEARRQIRKLYESQGIDLFKGIEELQSQYLSGRLKDNPKTPDVNEKQQQLFNAIGNVVKTFKDDIPAGVDVSAIAMKHFTEKAGVDIDAFNRELEKTLDIFGRLKDTEKKGLRTGLNSAVDAFARRDALLAAGGPVNEIIRSGLDARAGLVTSLYEAVSSGFSTAIIDGLQDAIQETPEWTALSERIAGAVNGAPIGDIAALVGDLFGATLPQIEAAAQTVAALKSQIGLTPTALRGSADAIATQVEQRRFNALNPRQQEAYINRRLGSVDEKIRALYADGVITPDEVPLLQQYGQEKAGYGFQLADLAGQRYAPGSQAYRRAIEQGLSISEDAEKLFRDAAAAQQEQIDRQIQSQQQVADSTAQLTAAIDRNTEAILGASGGPGGRAMIVVVDTTGAPVTGESERQLTTFVNRMIVNGKLWPTAHARLRSIGAAR